MVQYQSRWKGKLLFTSVRQDFFLIIAFDKAKTYELASSLAIPTIPAPTEYPRVIKPRHSVVWKGGKAIGGTASVVFDETEARRLLFFYH